MSNNLAAYCPPVNSGSAAPPSSSPAAPSKRPPPSSSYNGNNFNDDNGDGEEEQKDLKRRCVDYHSPAVLDLTSRLYRKSNRRSHALPGGSGLAYPYLQCHTNYVSIFYVLRFPF